MDKEIEKKLDELFDVIVGGIKDKTKKIDEAMEKAIKEPCKISMTNDGVGTALEVEGGRLSLLLTLAGSEKKILKELNCSDMEFEAIKMVVDSKEANDNE